MKQISTCAAQGDLLLLRVNELPGGASEVQPTNGRHIVAHSETGHHHWLSEDGVTIHREPGDTMVCYLRVAGDYADLVHDRPWDTHETIRIPRGTYQLRRQREYTPEGWRRVED